ncbi:MAG TPA: hypothetical protein PK156_50475, partial [Polyangium sp.]|nr:hypothetical protein [Polyangium sp.]
MARGKVKSGHVRQILVAPRLVPRSADVVGDGDVFVAWVFRPDLCAPPPDQRIDVFGLQATHDLGPFS